MLRGAAHGNCHTFQISVTLLAIITCLQQRYQLSTRMHHAECATDLYEAHVARYVI